MPQLYALAAIFICCAALSAGNAGTGFRYRSHLVTLGIAAAVVLREHVLVARAERKTALLHRPHQAPALEDPVSSAV